MKKISLTSIFVCIISLLIAQDPPITTVEFQGTEMKVQHASILEMAYISTSELPKSFFYTEDKTTIDVNLTTIDEPVKEGLYVMGIESEEEMNLQVYLLEAKQGNLYSSSVDYMNINRGENYRALNLKGIPSGEYELYLVDEQGGRLKRTIVVQHSSPPSALKMQLIGEMVTIPKGNIRKLELDPNAYQDDEAIINIMNSLMAADDPTEMSLLEIEMSDYPINGNYFVFSLTPPANTVVELKVFDEEGFVLLVNKKKEIELLQGTNYLALEVSNIKNGTYYMETTDEQDKKIIRKFAVDRPFIKPKTQLFPNLDGDMIEIPESHIVTFSNDIKENEDYAIKTIMESLMAAERKAKVLEADCNFTYSTITGEKFSIKLDCKKSMNVNVYFFDEEGFSMMNKTESIPLKKGINYIGVDASVAKNGIYFFKIKDQQGAELTRKLEISR